MTERQDGVARPEPLGMKVRAGLEEVKVAQPDPVDLAQRIEDLQNEFNAMVFSINAQNNILDEAKKDGWPQEVLAFWLKEGREAMAEYRTVLGALEKLVGEKMSKGKETLEGIGTLQRSRDKSYANWQHDDLFRIVMDTVVVDPDTGEVLSPEEKIKRVYGSRGRSGAELPHMPGYNASKTILREWGIDPDEFADVTDNGGYKVSIR